MKKHFPERKKRIVVISVLIFLLLLNGVMVYQLVDFSNELKKTQEDLISTEELKNELQSELTELEYELGDYKQEVLELDTALQNRNQQLKTRTEELRETVNRHDVTKSELAKAREELGVLRYYMDKYQSQIDSLERANQALAEEKEGLTEDLKEEQRRYSRLKDENVHLSNRISMAERLEIKEIEATGVRYTAIGNRERSTTRADRVEKFRLCFTIDENEVAPSGNKNLFIRFLNPEGSTINIQEAGSGVFEYRGEEMLYTMLYQMDYQNQEYSECVYWSHAQQLQAGDYEVKLYADGQLIGEDKFQIR